MLKLNQKLNFLVKNKWVMSPNPKTLNYIRYKISKNREYLDIHKYLPVHVSFQITRRCNLSCNFCVVGNSLNPPDWRAYEATEETTKTLFSLPLLNKALFIMISGGEPTVNNELPNIISALKQQRRIVAMTTNGNRLNKIGDKLLSAGLDSCNVSLYEENLDILFDVLPYWTKLIPTKINKVIDSSIFSNTRPLEQTAEFALETGCTSILFQNTFPTKNALINLDNSVILDSMRLDYESIQRRINNKYKKLKIYWGAPAPEVEPSSRRCRRPWYFIGVNAIGDTAVCCNAFSCSKPNVFSTAPNNLINSSERCKIRKGLIDHSAPVDELCKGCFLLNDEYGSNI